MDWVSLSQTSGNSGTTVITVSAEENQTLGQLLKVFNVVSGTFSKQVVIQELSSEAPFEVVFSVTPSQITYNASNSSTTYTITATSNIDYTIEVPDWINISSSTGSSGTTTFNVTLNTQDITDKRDYIRFINNGNQIGSIIVVLVGYSGEYLTFEVLSGGTLYWKTAGAYSFLTRTIEYKKNNDNWVSITSATGNNAPSISVSAGDIIKLRGDNKYYAHNNQGYMVYDFFGNDNDDNVRYNVYGNIMSLIDSTNFSTLTALTNGFNFYRLFCTVGAVNANNLVLPATILSYGCYQEMFNGCSSLVKAPKLPSTLLDSYCYTTMFAGCTSLIEAPELPATTLIEYCYQGMFAGCTSLLTAPEHFSTTILCKCSCR